MWNTPQEVKSPPWWFNAAQHIAPYMLGVIFSAGVMGITFYFTTNYHLTDHDTKFVATDKKFEDVDKHFQALEQLIREIKKSDEERRNAIRDEFLKRSEQTADGIAKLNTIAAVQDTTLKQVIAQLEKLNARFETLPLPRPAR
jgi:hypothetical protein